MNASEAATVLAVVAVLDGRHRASGPEEAQQKARAWAVVLDDDMPVKWAHEAVAAHYAEGDRALMPSDLNKAWRAERRRRRDAEIARLSREEQERQALMAVPMPDTVREQIRALMARQREVTSD